MKFKELETYIKLKKNLEDGGIKNPNRFLRI